MKISWVVVAQKGFMRWIGGRYDTRFNPGDVVCGGETHDKLEEEYKDEIEKGLVEIKMIEEVDDET